MSKLNKNCLHTLRRSHFTSQASFTTLRALQVSYLKCKWFWGLMGPPCLRVIFWEMEWDLGWCFRPITDFDENRCGGRSDPKNPKNDHILGFWYPQGWFIAIFSPELKKIPNLFFGHNYFLVAPIKKLVNTNIGDLVPGYADVEAQWAYFKGANSRRVRSFGTFFLLAILFINISQIRRLVLNERVNAIILSNFGSLSGNLSWDIDQNVFLAFYSIISVPGHFWSHLATLGHTW